MVFRYQILSDIYDRNSHISGMDDSLFEEVAAGVVLAAAQYYSSYFDKKMRRTSILSGHEYTKDVLEGHSAVLQRHFGMPPATLNKLQEWLFDHTQLAPSRTIGIAEKSTEKVFHFYYYYDFPLLLLLGQGKNRFLHINVDKYR